MFVLVPSAILRFHSTFWDSRSSPIRERMALLINPLVTNDGSGNEEAETLKVAVVDDGSRGVDEEEPETVLSGVDFVTASSKVKSKNEAACTRT